MSAPIRVQLKRTAGWKMPPNTKKVDRTTHFGNPFAIGIHNAVAGFTPNNPSEAVAAFEDWIANHPIGQQRAKEAKERLRGVLPSAAIGRHADFQVERARSTRFASVGPHTRASAFREQVWKNREVTLDRVYEAINRRSTAMIFLLCLFGISSVLGWSFWLRERLESQRLRKSYQDALNVWQESILMCASVDADNARLIRMLQDQHIDGEDWKRADD